MAVTRELVQEVRKRITENPGQHTASLASELNASESEVIIALPLEMRLRARNSDFESVRASVAAWKNALVTVSDAQGGHRPLKGGVRPGSEDGGDCPASAAINGLSAGEVGYIWFISKPLHGQETHSVQFFNKSGGHLLSAYLESDSQGALDAAAKADFDDMRRRFGVTPMPRNRCKGCGKCTCGGKKHAQGHQHTHHAA